MKTMMKKVMLKLLGVFILTSLQAQVDQDPSPLERFDSILLADTTTIRVSNDVNRLSGKIAESDILVYDSRKASDRIFWEKILCSTSIEERRKLPFVRAAIEDQGKDAFKYKAGVYCPCLKEQSQLARLLSDHFLSVSNFGEDRLDSYQYILFVTVNGLPHSTEVIDRYFKERDSYEHQFIFETKLPVYLIKKGEIDKAFELVRFFVEEQRKGAIKSIHDGDHYEKENVFALLYFSGDEEMKQKTLDLAFSYYNHIPRGYTSSLRSFLKYVDLERFKTSIEAWLEKYEAIDTSVYSNNRGYCSIMFGDGRLIAEEKEGYAYWKEYIKGKDRWKNYNTGGYEQAMLTIALSCMESISEESRKREIIDYILEHHPHFNGQDTYKRSRKLRQFLKLVLKYKPSIQDEEIEEYIPAQYKKYDSWKQTLKDVRTGVRPKQPSAPLSERMVAFQQYGFAEELELTEYDEFLAHLGRLTNYELVRKTGNSIWFDTEGGMFPLSYSDLFNSTFLPVFINNQIDYLEISESQEITNGKCRYQIAIHNGRQSFEFSFENSSDWYEVTPFVKAINLALQDADSDRRLIYLDSQDQTTLLGLFNPNDFIPLAKELNVSAFAVEYGDDLME